MSQMFDRGLALLPNLVLGALVLVLFLFAGKGVRVLGIRLASRARKHRNVGLVLGGLFQWALVLLGVLVALSIIVPSFKASKTFLIEDRRTPMQDLEFSINQLVEIAPRALSPGINDPFTAAACIDWLGEGLCKLAARPLADARRRDEHGALRIVGRPFTFEGVAASRRAVSPRHRNQGGSLSSAWPSSRRSHTYSSPPIAPRFSIQSPNRPPTHSEFASRNNGAISHSVNQTPHKPGSAWRASIMRPDPFAPRQTSLIVALLATVALCGCQGERQPYDGPRADSSPSGAQSTAVGGPDRTPQATDRTPTVEQVKEAPQSFYGQQVRLVGEVDEVLSDRSFELEGTGWAFGDNIIVLTKTPVQFASGPLGADSEVIVAGTVRRYVKQEIERDLGWTVTPELETKVKERPVIIADTIRQIGDYGYDGRWSADGRAGPPEPVRASIMITTAANPGVLAGQRAELRRERVQSVMGKGLWIGPGHMSQVFVLPATMPKDVQAGDLVEVSGVLRKVPKDAARTWGIPPEMAGVVREETLYIEASAVREVPAQAPR